MNDLMTIIAMHTSTSDTATREMCKRSLENAADDRTIDSMLRLKSAETLQDISRLYALANDASIGSGVRCQSVRSMIAMDRTDSTIRAAIDYNIVTTPETTSSNRLQFAISILKHDKLLGEHALRAFMLSENAEIDKISASRYALRYRVAEDLVADVFATYMANPDVRDLLMFHGIGGTARMHDMAKEVITNASLTAPCIVDAVPALQVSRVGCYSTDLSRMRRRFHTTCDNIMFTQDAWTQFGRTLNSFLSLCYGFGIPFMEKEVARALRKMLRSFNIVEAGEFRTLLTEADGTQ